MNWKRILLIIGIIASAFLIAVLLYILFFAPASPPVETTPITTPDNSKPSSSLPISTGGPQPSGFTEPTTTPNTTTPPTQASPVANGGLTQTQTVIQAKANFPALSGNGNGINYYDASKGQFFRVTPSGSQLLSDAKFPSVQKVVWSPHNDKAIMRFPDNTNIMYDFTAKQQVTLPKHWQDFNFAPDGNRVAFKSVGVDFDNRWLAVATPAGDEVRIIEPLGNNADKVKIAWSPNNQVIAFMPENLSTERSELFFVGFNHENFKSTTMEGLGFVGQWTPKGDKILYSVYSNESDNKPALWTVDANITNIGNAKKPIGLATWADKCVIASDNNTAYCAAPQNMPRGAGIVRQVADGLPDAFYKVSLNTGNFEQLAVPVGNVSAINLILSSDEKTLYFLDSTTSNLNSIKLK